MVRELHANLHAILLDNSWCVADTSNMATKTRRFPAKKKRAAPARKKAAVQAVKLPAAGTQVRSVREQLGLTQGSFARLTGFSVRTIADWEGGKPPAAPKAQRMTEVQRLQQALARVIRPEFVGQWLQSPNEAFAGLKPMEVIERGEVDRIWRMIYELESGIPT
jgi:DNA-binding transcriptional regulator YiaG